MGYAKGTLIGGLAGSRKRNFFYTNKYIYITSNVKLIISCDNPISAKVGTNFADKRR
jgi:hypothetical protein